MVMVAPMADVVAQKRGRYAKFGVQNGSDVAHRQFQLKFSIGVGEISSV